MSRYPSSARIGTSLVPGRHDEAGWCEQVVAAGMLLRSTETKVIRFTGL
jgi:hypothetical protein